MQTIKASAAGQYRLSATLNDGQGHTIEGGYLFTITGPGFDGAAFRFNDLEIIPDAKEYKPGDRVRLQINTDQPGATVLLFSRPVNGVYLPPKVVHLAGKSTIEEVPIVTRDMPNIYVEALTIARGKVHAETRNLAVPPESRVVDVAVTPSSTTYKPGQKAKVQLKLTGIDGKPFIGSTVLTVYDKAVEYISGGSNVPDIKSFFWQWKRQHTPNTESSLDRHFGNQLKPGEAAMQDLGTWGFQPWNYFSDMNGMVNAGFGMGGMGGGGRSFFAAGTRGLAMSRAMPAAAAPEAAPAGAVALGAQGIPVSGFEAAKLSTVSADAFGGEGQAHGPGGAKVQPVVRTNFADTAFWAAAVTTKPDGTAELEFPLPESLTTWKVKAWTMGRGAQVGQADVQVITTKDLVAPLAGPALLRREG